MIAAKEGDSDKPNEEMRNTDQNSQDPHDIGLSL